jgi:hypothetical protein
MATVVHDAVHTNESLARVAEVLHQFFWVLLAEVGLFQQLLLPLGVIKGDEVLGQLLGLERLLDVGSADGTHVESLLLDLDEALFTEGVAAVEIPGNAVLVVEEFIAGRAVHWQ